MAGRYLRRPRYRQDGIALIAVLWLTVLLTVIASSFAFSMRSEALAARNALSVAQARAAADGAVERTVYELQRPRSLTDVWAADGTPHQWQEGDAAITTVSVDESAKIDLNSATDPLLKGLLQTIGGLDTDAAGQMLDVIADWRDADDLKRPNGAEAADYEAAGLKYKPSNAPFANVGELQRVLGMTPELFARLADSLTVYSRQPGINPQTASRNVLLSVPGATADVVDAYIQQRTDALLNKLPIPPFPAIGTYSNGAIPVWRIEAQAVMPDGVSFVREAVVRPSPDPRKPMIALLWQEGSPLPPPPAPGDGAQDPNSAAPANGQVTR